jgi:hypothetical protein
MRTFIKQKIARGSQCRFFFDVDGGFVKNLDGVNSDF